MEDAQQGGPLLLGGDTDQGGPMIVQEESDMDMYAVGVAEDVKASAPSPEEQAATIQQLEDEDLQPGEQTYILDKNWWGEWCAYTNYKQPADSSTADTTSSFAPPLEIDNSSIVDNNSGDLLPDLEENQQFVIVRSRSWELLHSWYGGGPAVSRPAFSAGLAPTSKKQRVNVYPWTLELVWSGDPLNSKKLEAGPWETVQSFKERACKEFNVDPDKIDVWDYFNRGKHANLEPCTDKTLEEARILDEQPILLDDKDKPLEEEPKSSSSPVIISTRGFGRSFSLQQEDSTVQRSDGRPGLVGLQNLGNTCFMNSSLQCLMHSVPIMSMFLSGAYEADLNTTNPLGMKGQLATAFGGLMGNVWRPEVGTVVPRGFKAKIAQFAPQFSGYAQHDSQEFLAFLLDGLHEDINRIQVKPYIEEPDSEGVPDDEQAARAWDNYRARNDSHIVDHFQGLLKSTLVCPQCSYSSVKFDPFMYLSLPLPESRVRQLTAILLHADGAALPREYGFEVPQSGTMKDMYTALARVAGLTLAAPEQQMVAARLAHSNWGYNLDIMDDPKARVSDALCRDSRDNSALLVYYYRKPEYGPAGEGNQKVLVFHNRSQDSGSRRSGSSHFFSAPLLLWVPLDQTYDPMVHVISTTGSSAPSAGSSGDQFNFSSSKDPEYIVTEDAPIWSHIRRVLQPFLAVPTLRQQPAAVLEADDTAAADMMQQDGQQQQPAGSTGPADMSVAAASALPASTVASPSHEPCCTSKQSQDAAAAAAGDDAEGNNSTWGSHGSISPRSEMDVGTLDDLDEALHQVDDSAAAAAVPAGAAGMSANDDSPPQLESDGELDANAAFALQQLNSGVDSSTAAGSSEAAGGSLMGAGGVPVQPLDIWAAVPQQQQQPTTSPATSPPGSTTAAEGVGPATHSSSSCWPHYQLKLARDDNNYTTVAHKWNQQSFHPHVHHSTFVLDWDVKQTLRVPFSEYVQAAEAAARAAAAGEGGQQQQQDGEQQQQNGNGGSSSLGNTFWVPDVSSMSTSGTPSKQQTQPEDVLICGDYCISALEQPEYDESSTAIKAAKFERKSVALDACVEAFLQPEQLSEADEWYCPKCKEHVQADKKLDLWSLPEVLVVHLKRFSYTRYNRDKLDTEVQFPLQELDLSRYVLHTQQQPPIYDCYAVSNHYGGLGGGHYTAFAQMPNDRKWYCFDDSRVEEMARDGVQTKAAYVLFYRRRQQVQADSPSLVDELLFKRQQHLEQKRLGRQQQQQRDQDEAAVAAAAAAGGEPPLAATAPRTPVRTDVGMDMPAVCGGPATTPTAAAAAAGPTSPGDEHNNIWGSPSPCKPGSSTAVGGSAAAAARDAAAAMHSSAPASPVAALPGLGHGGVRTLLGAAARAAESTSTSTGGVGAGEEEESSDGGSSSSRPWGGQRGRGGTAQQAQQQQQANAWEPGIGALHVDPEHEQESHVAAGTAMGHRRQSDQQVDADMADRDA